MILKPDTFCYPNKGHISNRGVVGCWLENEKGTGRILNDLSGNKNVARLAGSAILEPGRFGLNPHYDGSTARHRIEYSPELYCGDFMSLSFWAKSDIVNYLSNAYIFAMYDYAGNNRVWAVRITAANDQWTVATSSDGTGPGLVEDFTGLNVDTLLHHFVFIANNPLHLWDFYFDGDFYCTLDVATYTNQNSFVTIAGLDGTGWFDGIVDFPIIFDRALNLYEIRELYWNPFYLFGESEIKIL